MTIKSLYIGIILLLLTISSVSAVSIYSRPDGTWAYTNGGVDCACTPASNDFIFVNHDIVITGNFTVGGSGAIFVDAGTLIITGDLRINKDGTVAVSSTLVVNGSMRIDNGSGPGNPTGGALIINIGGEVVVNGDFENKNNNNGVEINGTLSVDGNLKNGNGSNITGTGSIAVGGTIDDRGSIGGGLTVIVGPLPIELFYFKSKVNNNTIKLLWATASEINFDYFTVERSIDGKNFEAIGEVNGHGDSNEIIYYSHVDSSPIAGISYYRLKATDFDGSVEYHQVISVNFKVEVNKFIVYPNPVRSFDRLNIMFSSNSTINNVMTISDSFGSVIYQGIISNGVNSLTLPNNINPGVYIISVNNGNQVKTTRLIVN